MLLGGYQKLTLIDYPGKIACTVFTAGCNFRCPFCHNPELVLAKNFPINAGKFVEKEFFKFLGKRRNVLEGVCVTGGEPTLQPDLVSFIKKIKKLGYLVKLDTNGSRPDVIKKLLQLGILDFVAMDIKGPRSRYSEISGVETDIKRIEMSVELIKNSAVTYEFRTTVVPGLHQEKDFEEIAEWLSGARSYFLQSYREIKILDPKLKRITRQKALDLEKIKKKIEGKFVFVGIRQ